MDPGAALKNHSSPCFFRFSTYRNPVFIGVFEYFQKKRKKVRFQGNSPVETPVLHDEPNNNLNGSIRGF